MRAISPYRGDTLVADIKPTKMKFRSTIPPGELDQTSPKSAADRLGEAATDRVAVLNSSLFEKTTWTQHAVGNIGDI
jgi:hypothetical protein